MYFRAIRVPARSVLWDSKPTVPFVHRWVRASVAADNFVHVKST